VKTLAALGLGAVPRKNPHPNLPRKKVATITICCITNTMPAPTDSSSKKRKSGKNASAPSSKRRAVAEDDFAERLSTIQELENQIAESRKHYNNIATLISMLNVEKSAEKPDLAVAVSLCRVFSRLIAGGNLTESTRAAENEKIIVAWLKERCVEYQNALLAIMREADGTSQVCILLGCSIAFTDNL
jgi:U3 small nucleolar RNA-associated protein 19